jgi:NAD(P)-dependent dehydrogenase (short-subunit alcohol dehydrogenase family)
VIVTALASWFRMPCSAAYSISKHAVNALGEFLAKEATEIKTFCVHPGGVITDMTRDKPDFIQKWMMDTLDLSACTMLKLTNGEYDWLNGR